MNWLNNTDGGQRFDNTPLTLLFIYNLKSSNLISFTSPLRKPKHTHFNFFNYLQTFIHGCVKPYNQSKHWKSWNQPETRNRWSNFYSWRNWRCNQVVQKWLFRMINQSYVKCFSIFGFYLQVNARDIFIDKNDNI